MTVNLAMLGDSIALGVGASDPADTIGERLIAVLDRAGIDARLQVFAVAGVTSAALSAQVSQARTVQPTVAIVIIGANDLTHFAPARVAATQLSEAVRGLRAAGAAVIVVPAPDLSIVPWVTPNLRPVVQAACTAFRQAQTHAARLAGAVVVDAFAEGAARSGIGADLFSADRFHPSSAGYAVLADAVAPAVISATGSQG